MVVVPPTLALFSFCMSHSSCAVVGPTTEAEALAYDDDDIGPAVVPDTNPPPGIEPAAGFNIV